MIVGINVYMIGVQIYYTVYDRRTRVSYAVAVGCVVLSTTLYGIQYHAAML